MTDHALDALLAEYTAPPVPAGLAARVAAAAIALPQEPRARSARRAVAAPRHDRRRRWLRRPLLLGGVALGLAVSGAVAATLAGLRIDWPAVEAVLGDVPFVGRETRSERPAPPRAAPPPTPALPAVESAPALASRIEDRAEAEPTPPRVPAAREEPPPVAAPARTIPPADVAGQRLIETRPVVMPRGLDPETARPVPVPPAPAERETPPATSVDIARPLAADADEALRLRQQQLERAERLRAARQAQIERLQRVQQRRERLRRLRRD